MRRCNSAWQQAASLHPTSALEDGRDLTKASTQHQLLLVPSPSKNVLHSQRFFSCVLVIQKSFLIEKRRTLTNKLAFYFMTLNIVCVVFRAFDDLLLVVLFDDFVVRFFGGFFGIGMRMSAWIDCPEFFEVHKFAPFAFFCINL